MQTIGDRLVRADFNASDNKTVDDIKTKTAELINLLDGYAQQSARAADRGDPKDLMRMDDVMRCTHFAISKYEEAAMWAVKAVTTQ